MGTRVFNILTQYLLARFAPGDPRWPRAAVSFFNFSMYVNILKCGKGFKRG